jgi:hypothetical protein
LKVVCFVWWASADFISAFFGPEAKPLGHGDHTYMISSIHDIGFEKKRQLPQGTAETFLKK